MRNFIISLILCCTSVTAFADVELKDLADNAPDRYVVVPGDTLWDISARFLKSPWRWPDLWKKNQQIKDPHWIYPGDILALTRGAEGASLGFYVPTSDNTASGVADVTTPEEPGTVKLQPHLTRTDLSPTPIRVISGKDIEALIAQPAILSEKTLEEAPHVASTQDSRIALGRGDEAYVEGLNQDNGSYWKIVRRGDPIKDPDSGKMLGYFAPDLGNAQLNAQDKKVSTVKITKSAQEINVGDALIAADDSSYPDYQPHAPNQPISGRVAYITNDLFETGTGRLVVINKGIKDGLEDGNVLALYRDVNNNRNHDDAPIADRNGKQGQAPAHIKLSPERNGLLLVVRVFNQASYALIMVANRPVSVGDSFTQP